MTTNLLRQGAGGACADPSSSSSFTAWYLVAANDQAIPPDAERQFAARMGATTVEIPSGHLAMVSHSGEVVRLIQAAAQASSTAG